MTCLINHFTNKLTEVCLINSSFSFSSLGTWAILQKKNVPVKAKKGRRAIPWWLEYLLKQGSTLACGLQTSQACTDVDPTQVFKAVWWTLCSHHTPQVEGQALNHSPCQQNHGMVWARRDFRDHLVPIPFHGQGCHSLDQVAGWYQQDTRSVLQTGTHCWSILDFTACFCSHE